jgi:adenosylcobinamide-GDP ribazoletransferase
MKAYYLGLKLMFSYFTILPMPFKKSDDLSSSETLASMLFFLPLAGLVLGVMMMLLFNLLHSLAWLAALLCALGYMMLYGFLHTEAIMDVADAIYASHSGKDAYAIIKEPSVGAMGVLWGVSLLLTKVAILSFLLLSGGVTLAIALFMVSRLALQLLFLTQTFRSSFLTQLKTHFKPTHFLLSLALFGSVGLVLLGWHFVWLLLFGLVLSFTITQFLKKKLGFVNGDVLGTTLELTEILLMLLGALLWL